MYYHYGFRSNLTLKLVLVCMATFFFQLLLPIEGFLAFTPSLALYMPWTFITSIFLHADFFHLFFNMFALFTFGSYLENVIGRKKFLTLFFVSGFLGNLAYFILDPFSSVPAVGASGAIYGIIGCLALLRPSLIVYINWVPVPLIIAAIIWLFISFVGMFLPSHIAHEAHLAGLLFGLFYGRKLKREALRRHTLFFEEPF